MANATKKTSSVRDIAQNCPAFGSRFLTEEQDVWAYNAWDHVPPPTDQHEIIAASLARQRAAPVAELERAIVNEKPAKHWDNFYKNNADNFFKNRKWLHLEFHELVAATHESAGPKTVVEFGCGAGNSIFPLLADNKNPELTIHAFDYSSHAVKLVQRNELYQRPPCGTITAAVHDLTAPALPLSLAPHSVDFVILVFVLSALHPSEWPAALRAVHTVLKPGGMLLFRDYGRHDLTQLRFKANRLLDDNFYARGDKTRVYFFELDELAMMFTGQRTERVEVRETTEVEGEQDSSGNTPADASRASPSPLGDVQAAVTDTPAKMVLEDVAPDAPESTTSTDKPSPMTHVTSPSSIMNATALDDVAQADLPSSSATTSSADNAAEPSDAPVLVNGSNGQPVAVPKPEVHPSLLAPFPAMPPHPLFEAIQLGVDRRLIVNRKRQLKMYRVWMQGKFVKL